MDTSELVTILSQELRSPINSILMLSDILLLEIDGTVNEEQEKQLKIIKRNSETLLHLVNSLLDISAMESGALTLQYTTFDIVSLIEDLELPLAPLMKTKGVTFRVQPVGTISCLYSDRTRVKQLMYNLISDAVRFKTKGALSVKIKTTSGRSGENGSISVAIQGISKRYREDLLQILRGAEAGPEYRRLELRMAKNLLRLLGGKVRADNRTRKDYPLVLTFPLC